MAYIVTVDAVAVTVTALLALVRPVTSRDWALAGIFLAAGIVQSEFGRHVERSRRRHNDTPHINMTSVWTLPAALLLPPALVAVVVAGLYVHLWVRSWYPVSGAHAFKITFSALVAILSCHVAWAVYNLGPTITSEGQLTLGSVAWLGLTVLIYVSCGALLVGGAIATLLSPTEPRTVARLFGSWSENVLELATLCLGAAAAVLVLASPALLALLLVPLFVLHRSVLLKQLEQAATADEKTGLLKATAWQQLARRELAKADRSGAPLAVLMIDLDHFKRVNDTYGHLAGDEVLRAVAGVLRTTTRRYDVVSRFGGEEFVVLLPDTSAADAQQVAERIRDNIRELAVAAHTEHGTIRIKGLTVSIGVAIYARDGRQLEDLLLAADVLLFTAKHGGRDQVRLTRVSRRVH